MPVAMRLAVFDQLDRAALDDSVEAGWLNRKRTTT